MIPCVASVSVWFRSKKKRNDEEKDFRFWPREKWNEIQKMKEGGGGGGGEVSFFSSPPLSRSFTCPIFRAVFDFRSSFFAPKLHGNTCCAGYQYDDLFVK